MTATLTIHRPAKILSGHAELEREMRSAHWVHHRLLDYEDRHQRLLDRVQERVAPGITRVSRLVARLRHRKTRAQRSTQWVPGCHPQLATRLEARLKELRKQRDPHPLWKQALARPRTADKNAPVKQCRRKRDESDEAFEARKALGKRRTRRERYRVEQLYPRAHIFADTWNALQRSVDQAVSKVISERAKGLPAQWRRPLWDHPRTIVADQGHWRIIERGGGTTTSKSGQTVGNPWWVIETRVLGGWVRFKAKLGNWHDLEDAKLKRLQLTRRKRGGGWEYSVSIMAELPQHDLTRSVGATPETKGRRELLDGAGTVALDWGHREYGHPLQRHGLRAFTWLGDDGQAGEVLLPIECRQLRDAVDQMKYRVDQAFDARRKSMGIPELKRQPYRKRLMNQGVRTREEALWLAWETRYERRMAAAWDRIKSLRAETYLRAVRELRIRYRDFVTEDEPGKHHRQLDIDEMTRRRKRQNRDMVARYEFLSICERLGGTVSTVPSRNTTRECPVCGHLRENGPELIMVCPGCGTASDKDEDATITILRRALASHAAE